jgi:hypothetical protein
LAGLAAIKPAASHAVILFFLYPLVGNRLECVTWVWSSPRSVKSLAYISAYFVCSGSFFFSFLFWPIVALDFPFLFFLEILQQTHFVLFLFLVGLFHHLVLVFFPITCIEAIEQFAPILFLQTKKCGAVFVWLNNPAPPVLVSPSPGGVVLSSSIDVDYVPARAAVRQQ